MPDSTRLFRRAINYELSERKLVPMETARVQESCLPSGVCEGSSNTTTRKIPPVKSRELGVPEGLPRAGLRQIQ